MNLDEIRSLDINGVEARVAQIANEINNPGANLDALNAEMDALEERRNALRHEAEQRRALNARIAAGQTGNTIRNFVPAAQPTEQRNYNAGSPEYRSAWLKQMAVVNGHAMFGELTEEERTAYTVTTSNTSVLVPTEIQNRIVELVLSESPMLADATMTSFTSGFGVPRHTGTAAGDAKGVTEGTANPDDEQDNFDLMPLDGVEIKKHVVLTRKMQFQSISAYEDWLVGHIAERIRVAKERHILARLSGTAPDGGIIVAAAGLASSNVLTGESYDDDTIRKIMGMIEANGEVIIYANRKTIWHKLAGIVDGDSRKLFVPNSMTDPISAGRIYGATVKPDNNLADNVVYFLVKGQVQANDFDALALFSAVEPRTVNTIHTGYALFDAGILNPKGGVKVTFTP